ncbi:PepSY domain-containing protein [Clostridium baratii]|uniref:PepSY domain-containing protein n=1 Tax=Clostridium baratii TaxID=1561 RepID=UPI0030D47BA0
MNKFLKGILSGVAVVIVSSGIITYASNNRKTVQSTFSQKSLIDSSAAKQLMLSKVPGGKFINFSFDNDETPKYEGKIIKDNVEYEIDVDAKNGSIIKFDKETISINNQSTSNTSANSNKHPNTTSNSTTQNKSSTLISAEKSKEIMKSKVGSSNFVSFHFDNDETPEYEGKIRKDNIEYEIDVDARTGSIINFDKETISKNKQSTSNVNSNLNKPSNTNTNSTTQNTSSKFISAEKAKEIMKNKVGSSNFISFHLDNDETPEYEGKIIKGNFEYEISVDAKTGSITEFDKDTLDEDCDD